MKITSIELKGYNQFKDVTIDLTYPEGHEKVGRPLDKVCFIGQSGTGKTSLLRLLKWFVSDDRSIGRDINLDYPPGDDSVKMSLTLRGRPIGVYSRIDGLFYTSNGATPTNDPDRLLPRFSSIIDRINPLLINYPADLLDENWQKEETEPGSLNGAVAGENGEKIPGESESRHVIDFAFEDVAKVWDLILKDIKDHRAQEILLKNKIADTASQQDATLEEIEKTAAEYKKWLAENPKSLQSLADNCLDPVLEHLGLKTKTEIDLKSILDLGFIALQTLDGLDLPRDFWSTGTRQLVQTLIPLYQLKPKDGVILIDEPERSLYPDIQRSIIDTYVKLAPECQFFIATHSPIIASSFEPWEIVELKFDNDHKHVTQELSYDGNRHVDNYKYYPQYLRWDSILNCIFDLDEEGGKKRMDALVELARVKDHLAGLKKEGKIDSPDGKQFLEKFKSLAHKLDWQFN